ncbi:unnamed protein product [Ilex paraguariensis]|uniref:Uncharacterized protein n=1 Tax=Ilex paraguariensis TaxID=185542 RepID=A0ABC8S173_9AQUA
MVVKIARKITIHGLGKISCIPAELATHATNGSACVDTINNAVQLFDKRLKPLVDDLNKDLHDAKFIYINTTSITSGNLSDLGVLSPSQASGNNVSLFHSRLTLSLSHTHTRNRSSLCPVSVSLSSPSSHSSDIDTVSRQKELCEAIEDLI